MIIRKCFSANLMFPVGFPYFSKCGYLEFRIFAQRKIKEQILTPSHISKVSRLIKFIFVVLSGPHPYIVVITSNRSDLPLAPCQ